MWPRDELIPSLKSVAINYENNVPEVPAVSSATPGVVFLVILSAVISSVWMLAQAHGVFRSVPKY
jgi:hypothetical protein